MPQMVVGSRDLLGLRTRPCGLRCRAMDPATGRADARRP